MQNSCLKMTHISKMYDERPVLKDISIEISSKEIVGVLGPNGAGKTTLFSILMGLLVPDTGVVTLDNLDITNLHMHKRARLGITYLPQESSIFKGMTVAENIMAVLEIIEPIEEKRLQTLDKLLSEFSISHLSEIPAVALSGGERRRLEIARALAINPKFILLDEPFAGIDPVTVSEIKKIIFQLKEKNICVVITDHNVKETLNIIDKCYIIYDGRVIMHGTKEDIVNSEDVRKIYLGSEFKL